jgi:hypothetical protein
MGFVSSAGRQPVAQPRAVEVESGRHVHLEHDPEKWMPVFRKNHAPTKKLDHDPILFDRIMV